MSDLFIGEILGLLLFIPVLFRPFSRHLQAVNAIPVLPLFSFIIYLLIAAGSGMTLSFLPVFLFSLFMLLSGFPRLIRFFRKLPTDWYSLGAQIRTGFVLPFFACAVFCVFYFAPEAGYMPSAPVRRSVISERAGPGVTGRYVLWERDEDGNEELPEAGTADSDRIPEEGPQGVIIFFSDTASSAEGRSTMSLALAEKGFTVLSADFSGLQDYRSVVLSLADIRRFAALTGRIFFNKLPFTNDEEIFNAQYAAIRRMIQFAKKNYGETVPLFAIAEGSACIPLMQHIYDDPGIFTGSVCLMGAENEKELPEVPGGSVHITGETGMMPVAAAGYPVMILTAEKESLFGYGEIRCDDVLAAFFAGSGRDTDRKSALLTGRRIISWITMRRDQV
ncbi:hypothetical protein K7I13_10665 [Brucepastera parasyntrophica]|uniref:hypothetical protein n=1 Tax=Brucepastera parasyntrophica TaxID=2880008 RepID=UPI00210C2035|nr:hypothetical protein [Brucepastera parasyntrophica]ULQ58976.1 hypothetical protein K7I13_10665 [Brucepastera parasyntrophica]